MLYDLCWGIKFSFQAITALTVLVRS